MVDVGKMRSLAIPMVAVIFAPCLALADSEGLPIDMERFEPEVALENLASVEVALESFRRLTDVWRSENDFDIDTLALVDWESQNLMFPNLVLSLEGTILLQQMRIAELQLAATQRDGMSTEQLRKAQTEYNAAAAAYRRFSANAVVAD